MPRPRLHRRALRIRGLSAVAPEREFDVGIYDEISEKSTSVSGLAHGLTTHDNAYFFADLLRYVLSSFQSAGGARSPTGVAVVGACVSGCVLSSRT